MSSIQAPNAGAGAATPSGQQVIVDQSACIGCGRCVEICPTDVFGWNAQTSKAEVSYGGDCCICLLCVKDCPTKCITVDLHVRRHFVSVYDRLNISLDVPPPTLVEASGDDSAN